MPVNTSSSGSSMPTGSNSRKSVHVSSYKLENEVTFFANVVLQVDASKFSLKSWNITVRYITDRDYQ